MLQITDMLQLKPEHRPSAVELVMERLPPLMEQLIREEEEEANEEWLGDGEASQRTRFVHCGLGEVRGGGIGACY